MSRKPEFDEDYKEPEEELAEAAPIVGGEVQIAPADAPVEDAEMEVLDPLINLPLLREIHGFDARNNEPPAEEVVNLVHAQNGEVGVDPAGLVFFANRADYRAIQLLVVDFLGAGVAHNAFVPDNNHPLAGIAARGIAADEEDGAQDMELDLDAPVVVDNYSEEIGKRGLGSDSDSE